MPKVSNDERALVKADVEKLLLEGRWSRFNQYELARKHGLTRRSIQRYRASVEAARREAIKLERPADAAAAWMDRCRSIRELAVSSGDYRAAANLLQLEARVLGIESPQRVHVTGGLELSARPERQLTDDELIARIEEKRKARACQVIELREVSAGDGYEPEG